MMEIFRAGPLEKEDIESLIEEICKQYGYDFSQYSMPSLHRRIRRVFYNWKFSSFGQFKERLLVDELFFEHFLQELTVTVTEMFRDPSFFLALQRDVFPSLKKIPFLRIWHAGCSTGEEAYSLAILLKEHGLLHKSRLYATDINSRVLANARQGAFPLEMAQAYNKNYLLAGGKADFADYYTQVENKGYFIPELRKPMVFASHNLVSDQSFNEFHLIVCRNVLIYFNKELQDRVLWIFAQSLPENGFLALGSKESVRFSNSANLFDCINKPEKIWAKKTLLS